MPELPEVETIVRYLRPKVRGKRILGVWTNTPRPQLGLRRRKVIDVHREGKNIVVELSGGRELRIHLMMTGKLLWNPANIREKHIRFWLNLSGGDILALHDVRKFGRVRLTLSGRGVDDPPAATNLGPDALSISLAKFRDTIKNHKGALKPLLLNQSILAGIGNIYSDEILWYAGIRPTRKANSLTEKEIGVLHGAMQKVLKLAIKKEGTSARDYRKPDGSEGGYYEVRKAYQRAGEKCFRDGAIIKRIVLGQRATHYCSKHQR